MFQNLDEQTQLIYHFQVFPYWNVTFLFSFLPAVSDMLVSIKTGLLSLVIYDDSLSPSASHPALPQSTAVKTPHIIPIIVSVCGLLF